MEYKTYDELFERSTALFDQAKALLAKPEATAEDLTNAKKMTEDAKGLRERSRLLQEVEELKGQAQQEAQNKQAAPQTGPRSLKTFGDYLGAVWNATFERVRHPDLKFTSYRGDTEKAFSATQPGAPSASKDLVENTGAAGGFLVFPEHRNELMMFSPLMQLVRQRAMVLRMGSRVMQIPVLNQGNTPTGGSAFFGGVIPKWTEEGEYKTESDPAFGQMELVAHKLITYTEVSDELLADSAIGLEDLLRGLFGGAIANELEWAYINGTGAGQPLGVINAPVTLVQPRAAANAIGLADIFGMVSQFAGQSPIWIAHQSTMPQILALNGPAGNPPYVWIGNGRDQMPTTLMGYPIFFVENAQPLGTAGDLGLADFSKYVIGERQDTTIDASKHYRFRYDLTSWRGVTRVDGRPWAQAPVTYRDGATQVSPFVILGGVGGS